MCIYERHVLFETPRASTDGRSATRGNMPATPPSSVAVSRRSSFAKYCPKENDLAYITEQLWSPKRRFSFENPVSVDSEESSVVAPLLLNASHKDDDSETIINDASPTHSMCSGTTLSWTPTPPHSATECPRHSKRAGILWDQPSSPCDAAEVTKRTSETSRSNSVPTLLSPMADSYQKPALYNTPKDVFVEEKSVWEDSDNEDDEQETLPTRFRRRFSNPLRTFLFKRRDYWRKSA